MKFARPVTVRVGGEIVVTGVNDAARILVHHWKDQNSAKRRAAMEACFRALRGEVHPPVARASFVAAALEAKVLVAD
jgi:hypothetical protein